jgi:hypothetical protein
MYKRNDDYATNVCVCVCVCMYVILERVREQMSMHKFIVWNENSRKGEQGEM